MKDDDLELCESEKRLTNRTARKTLIKKLKSSHVPRSEIIGITGHSRESGLDPYDSGYESEKRLYSNIIDNVETTTQAICVPNPSVCVEPQCVNDVAGPSIPRSRKPENSQRILVVDVRFQSENIRLI